MRNRSLLCLALLAFVCIVCFMTIGLRGNLAFVLSLRAVKLVALIEVGIAIAISTVVFQTVTANRILTPSIMGIDALYIFGQILFVFLFGGLAYATLDARLKFLFEIILLMALTSGLVLPMLRARWDMGLMLLSGVVVGVLFRSLHSLLARLIDPNEFAVVQGGSFVNFNDVQAELLTIASLLTVGALTYIWRARHVFDIVALGRDTAIGLGIEWPKIQITCLLLVCVLVAVSTALVGPVAFLGLLFVALAERIVQSRRHAVLIPAAALVAIIVLVGGQTLFQHGLGNSSTLGVVIEFIGGIVFLILLWRGSRR
ncbi:iron chelate uptake ABC transporter family permease subunit [Agrobacterium sp. rho-13.3]|uniref:iron chelate uptake ABC transporter family permease subunit n=1 Tax=Agrobacterium sp. rho-13.3 TaxID=3072980 RepID=UPI002A16B106|nr:iron chelate uptake ABC transporter family permease subunit [Agrobacterium sp. rho-13.3]MDX8308382.1 iron chelate uptake ABC transporter family permease subunit [Agrobacterium sp. rho-13.3]